MKRINPPSAILGKYQTKANLPLLPDTPDWKTTKTDELDDVNILKVAASRPPYERRTCELTVEPSNSFTLSELSSSSSLSSLTDIVYNIASVSINKPVSYSSNQL